MPPRYLTIAKFASESGYTVPAIYSKIRDNVWSKGRVWILAPDNKKLIDVKGYEEWVEAGPVLSVGRKQVSKLPLCTKASDAEKGFRASPRPLI